MPTLASWDTRIQRAQQLSDEQTPAKELLAFYSALLQIQKTIYDSLRGRRDWLPSGSLADDLTVLREYFPSFLKSVSSLSPPALAEKADASDELLLEYWHDRSDKLFFPKAFLQPYAQWLVESGGINRSPQSAENRCPCCFGKPQVSFLHVAESGSESGNRSLICATCLSAWEFRRLLCAACGEESPFKLGYFQTDKYPHVRIETCESCKLYIKGVDLTRLGFAVPLVDDVATAALDLWAGEKGYQKIELNLIGL